MSKREKYEEIEYIIPKNYDIKPKILGVIEQEALVLFIIINLLLFLILNNIINNMFILVEIMIIIALPQEIILIFFINGESILYFINYLVLYIFKEKVYLYEKQIIN